MKIALIDPSLFTWPYDNELAQGLRENGHEVVIYGKHLAEGEPGKGEPHYREFFYPFMQRRAMQALPKPVFLALKGLMHPYFLTKLLKELRQWRPDVIHFQWAPLPVIDRYFIPAFRRIAPVILTVHDSTPFNNNPRSRLQRVGSIEIFKQFDRLIVHTEQAKGRLIAYGLPEARIARIPHGLLESGIPSLPPSAAAAASTDRPVTLLLFGKLKPYKGADILIRALGAMQPQTRARCHVRIVGKSYMDVEPLRALAKEQGVESNIAWDLRFVDHSEMADIFSQADVMVMPYREIDASGVLMAALAMGRPIVASRIGLFSELLEDGKHGYLVPCEDVQGLSVALAKLVEDAKLRSTMGEEVRALKESIPGWRVIAQMTEALYRETIKEARG